jgi:hypothetical protein
LRSVLLAIAFASFATPHSPERDKPSLKDVVQRVTGYVEAYGEKASIVVATERYTQKLVSAAKGQLDARVMVADFAIVKADANHTWIGFRDVIEVDGKPLTDRDNRLVDVLSSSSGSIDEARRICDESARFNIGGVVRNFNVPTTVLFFFSRENVDRFKFSRNDHDAGGIWEIQFREVRKPTLIRTPEGLSVPVEGSVWVNPVDGTVLRTHLRLFDFTTPRRGSPQPIAESDVSFRRVDAMAMWLPDRMDESYLDSDTSHITGHAEYSNYRRFETLARIK